VTRTVKIKNTDSTSRTWLGQVVGSGEYYTVPGASLIDWANDSALLIDIADGYAIVNDGNDDITDVNDAINWLKGITTEKRTGTGILLTATTKPDYSDVKIFSHNFADPTTWFADSVRITEVLNARDTNGSVWYGTNRNWIDLTHGKIMGEDKMSSPYLPEIHVYDSYGEQCPGYQEKDPHTEEGDFVIDYESGEVSFDNNIFDNYTDGYVKATYNYENGSTMYVRPANGKLLSLERAEVQFTADVVIRDSVHFQLWIYAYIIETSLGYPIGTLAPYGEKYPYSAATIYKSTADFVAEANGNYPVCPAFGGSSWRGMTHDVITLPFDYSAVKPLNSSYGAEIRVWNEHHKPMEGSYGTVTFYCHSEDEET
jgi:hypothetical protein